MPDFEILWNGAHGNCDADLLVTALRIPVKRSGAPLSVSQAPSRLSTGPAPLPPVVVSSDEAYTAVLACLAHGAQTSQSIAKATGLSLRQVYTATQRVQRRGLAVSEPNIAVAPRTWGGSRTRWRLR